MQEGKKTGAWTGWRWLIPGHCCRGLAEGPCGSSIPESMCPHPQLLFVPSRKQTWCTTKVVLLCPPAPLEPDGSFLLRPVCLPARRTSLLGCHLLLLSTLVVRSKSTGVSLPASSWAQYRAAGEALGHCPAQPVLWWHWALGWVAAWQHQLQQKEMLPTSPESFLLSGELLFPVASQPQGVSLVIFLLFLMLSQQCVSTRPALVSRQVECGDLLWVSLWRAAIGHGWH